MDKSGWQADSLACNAAGGNAAAMHQAMNPTASAAIPPK